MLVQSWSSATRQAALNKNPVARAGGPGGTCWIQVPGIPGTPRGGSGCQTGACREAEPPGRTRLGVQAGPVSALRFGHDSALAYELDSALAYERAISVS